MSSSVFFYFNNDNGSAGLWSGNPNNLKDGDIATFAGTGTNNDEHHLDGNTYTSSVLHGTITNVYLRVYGNADLHTPFNGKLYLRYTQGGVSGNTHEIQSDLTGGYYWSNWYEITNDTKAPSTWTWTNIQNIDCMLDTFITNGFDVFEAAKVEIKVTYTGLIIYNGDTSVILDIPSSLIESTTKTVQNVVFNDGNDVQLDRGKTGDSLTLSGTETSTVTSTMYELNRFMDNRNIITVAGLPDSNLNTEYHISNFDFNQEAGIPDIYNYNITLERIDDRLG